MAATPPVPKAEIDNSAFVGRQPIYTAGLNIFGYELLFRSNNKENRYNAKDGNMATAQVVVQTFLDIGLEAISGGYKAFFNMTGPFLTGALPIPFGKSQVILEILENIPVSDEVLQGLKALKEKGYHLALDDFVFAEKNHPFLQFADIVKIDILQSTDIDTKRVREYHNRGLKLLAEKVETKEQFEKCKAMGFDYFQGYFLSKPQIIEGRRIPESKNKLMYLLARLQDPNIEFAELNELIKQDPSLSLKLLKYINSPVVGLRTQVQSIQQAIVLIGLNELKRWITLIVVAAISDRTNEVVRIALSRGKMCELLGKSARAGDPNTNFTIGLFSALDTMLDVPLEQVLKALPLAAHVNSALLTHDGNEGLLLNCVLAYEAGDSAAIVLKNVSTEKIRSSYFEAAEWADQTFNTIF